ncbi:hypothetical protein K2173_020528 [Erythroxylum novogranatense]|uniref:PUM-HD domain-containing protein n=1 Tax=Erythroxylum novogranatense TaxID=1862640 RepID=A0AAV8TGK4_9ROSI|nr:hypothetical protein K2173_020528 [Erythroxylum novogranatense]
MVTGSNPGMMSALGDHLQGSSASLEESLQNDLELILQARRSQRILGQDRNLNIYRSGSAPPTVEGSLSAVGSLFGNCSFINDDNISDRVSNLGLTEDEIRLHPAYLSYYYSHDNTNPRLPPPLISKEDWRVAQKFQGVGSSVGGIGEFRNKLVDNRQNSSLFTIEPGCSVQKMENDLMEGRNPNRSNLSGRSTEWLNRGSDSVIGLQGTGPGPRRKSFADILQDGIEPPVPISAHFSRPAGHNSFGNIMDTSDPCHVGIHEGGSVESLHSRAAPSGLVGVQGSTLSHSSAYAQGSPLSRSRASEQLLVARLSNSGLPPVGSRSGTTVQDTLSSGLAGLGEIAGTLSTLSLTNVRHADEYCHIQGQVQPDINNQPDYLFNIPNGHNQSLPQQLIGQSNAQCFSSSTNSTDVSRRNRAIQNLISSRLGSNREILIPRRTLSSVNLHSKMNSLGFESSEGANAHRQNTNISSKEFGGYMHSAYSVNQKLDTVIKSDLDSGGAGVGKSLNKLGNQVDCGIHSSDVEPHYGQYLQRTSDNATCNGSTSSDPQIRNYLGMSSRGMEGIQNAYLESLLAQKKQQFEGPFFDSGSLNQGYYKNPSYDLQMSYPGNSVASFALPSARSGSFQNEQIALFNSTMRNSKALSTGSLNSDSRINVEKKYVSSLLDEFKTNKTRSFELSDIVNHVAKFSMDQYGSRFIQQKLELATVEEKDKIFPEIILHAHVLMTDVFGNYVIQKFFEHSTECQRLELASQLTGHVLPLSLQMYGCRVIQKALEVIDVDHQTQIVEELDGSIMKCVRDQNGNHVIQKCIECVPEDRIQFIISSFYEQVVTLSTHPYGCRVIQRVLEHCKNLKTQQIIMDEIMQSVCALAQDQYGNYVIQHVLEHGNQNQRSAIISKLAGQIVNMSQQKFASNVVEKCLTFGSAEERQLLMNEMLGSTDENEPLQAMMKDPFGNYVVQKVIETCDDQNLEIILSRIKVHLNSLKRFTYSKHIVSRVEKLIVTGERRIGLSSSC